MKQTLILNVGQAGIRIGQSTWDQLIEEHGISPTGHKIKQNCKFHDQTIFKETSKGVKVPRTVFIDTDPDSIAEIQRGNNRQLYSKQDFISCKQDSSNNFVRANMTIGKQIIYETIDIIRKQIEACDVLEGIIINCAFAGGTGSGFTTLLLERLQLQIQRKSIGLNIILPSPHMSDCIVQPYNCVMGLGEIINHANQSVFVNTFDNQKLYSICEKNGIESPSYHEINSYIAKSTCLLTNNFRSCQDSSIGQLHQNIIPYKKMCYLSPSNYKSPSHSYPSIINAIEDIYSNNCSLFSYKSNFQLIAASMLIFKGIVSQPDVAMAVNNYRHRLNLADWCTAGIKIKVDQQIADSSSLQGLTLTNSSSFVNFLNKINNKYDSIFEKRAFVHWYVGEGLEDQYMHEGRTSTTALTADYQEMIATSNN